MNGVYPKKSATPKVTFVIPTLNASLIIRKCLTAIRSQNYPQKNVEIIIADGGSHDDTVLIAKQYDVRIINNPEILHEPGKSRALKVASGEIIFFTDADNILSHKEWLRQMVQPYITHKDVQGFLPQTIPAPDSNILDRYLGYLFTDPFSWFIYGSSANPKDYEKSYTPVLKHKDYLLYRFPITNYPLFGFSQGVGVVRSFNRGKTAHNDDILAGMKLIQENGLIAYIPNAGIYHYHVSSFSNFVSKYRWRIKNNFTQQIKGMGIQNRISQFDLQKKIKIPLFLFYSLTVLFPVIDSIKLRQKTRDNVMLIHPFVCFVMGVLIVSEVLILLLGINKKVGVYK